MIKYRLFFLAAFACLFVACEDEAEPDITAPLVTISSPADSTTFSQDENVYVKASVTDDTGLETVSLIVTPPDGTPLVFNEDKNSFTNNGKETLIDRTLSLNLLGSLTPGKYLLTVKATDVFENVTNESTTIFISESDTENPTISFNSPAEGASFTAGEDIPFSAAFSDDTGLGSVNVYMAKPGSEGRLVYSEEYSAQPAEALLEESISFNADEAAGEYRLRVELTDAAGNTAEQSRTIHLMETDGTAPTLSFLNPTEGMEFDTDDIMSIEIHAADNSVLAGALVQLTLPNGQTEELAARTYTDQRSETDIRLTYPFNDGSMVGEYTLMATVTDSEGNTAEESVKIQLLASDAEAPSITLSSPVAGTLYEAGETVEIDAAITDNTGIASASVILTYPDGQTSEIYAEEFADQRSETTISESIALPADAPVGTYTLTVNTTDLQGHTRSKSVPFEVQEPDNTAPTASIIRPADGTEIYLNNTLSLEAEAGDESRLAEVTVWLQESAGEPQLIYTENPESFLNDGKTAELIEDISLDGFTAGNYTLLVRATDKGGNTVDSSVQLTLLEPDEESPVITINSPTEGSSHARGSEVALDAKVTDNQQLAEVHVQVTVSFAGTTQSLYDETHTEFEDPTSYIIQETETIPADAPLGTYLVTITATDAAGNEEVKESTFEVTE